jgi:hypothetical protein
MKTMKIIFAIAVTIMALTLVPSVSGQITALAPSTGAGFVASSDVLAVDGPNGWGAGNLSIEAFDAIDYGPNKSNRIFLQGVELTAPAAGFSIFGGGLMWQPDISALLSKTNFASGGNFLAFVEASAGNGIPSAGSDRVSAILGGGVKYILSDNVTFNTIRCGVIFFGATKDPYCSSGIAGYFGGVPASAAVSSNVKKGLIRRIASATAKLKR